MILLSCFRTGKQQRTGL